MLVDTLMMKEARNVNVGKEKHNRRDAVCCPAQNFPWDFNDWGLERWSLGVHVSFMQITAINICHKNAQNNSMLVKCHVCKSVK